MIALTITWSLAFFFTMVFQCGTDWNLDFGPILPFLSECTNTLDMLTVFTATDIVSDLLIIAMPIPMVETALLNAIESELTFIRFGRFK